MPDRTAWTAEFHAKLRGVLEAYRGFSATHHTESCRLVHYAGVGKPNAIDVAVNEIEHEIESCLADGFMVGWLRDNDRTYLWVQEPGAPVPASEKVIAEDELVDVGSILKAAGFDQ
ncbi:hypothetical protein ACQ859_15180 [Roseateles chitinivorans]|uniref:hypothetical protein n=1 Tax=Roseateles chitinivorans TaxID=2917965 RepID=UPI003D67EC38